MINRRFARKLTTVSLAGILTASMSGAAFAGPAIGQQRGMAPPAQMQEGEEPPAKPEGDLAPEKPEGDLAPVTCLKKGEHCKRKAQCKTVFMWNKFYDIINKFFGSITIDDLLNDNKNFDLFTNIQQLL